MCVGLLSVYFHTKCSLLEDDLVMRVELDFRLLSVRIMHELQTVQGTDVTISIQLDMCT